MSRLMRELQLETLQERRRIHRLTFMCKILNGQVAVPAELIVWNYLYVQAEESITNRSCINLEHTLLNTRNLAKISAVSRKLIQPKRTIKQNVLRGKMSISTSG